MTCDERVKAVCDFGLTTRQRQNTQVRIEHISQGRTSPGQTSKYLGPSQCAGTETGPVDPRSLVVLPSVRSCISVVHSTCSIIRTRLNSDGQSLERTVDSLTLRTMGLSE